MRTREKSADLLAHLEELTRHARAGDRLPTVRDLMARFGLSQGVVQRAVHELARSGRLNVYSGRGIFFSSDGALAASSERTDDQPSPAKRAPLTRSVLIFRRMVSPDRGRYFAEQLTSRINALGHRVLEVGFSDTADALQVLRGLSRVDACVIQSVYRGIPSELLALLQEKSAVVVFDGISMVSEGVDSIGTEWGEPLAQAAESLIQLGHRRLCFAATSRPLLATTLGFRRWGHLGRHWEGLTLETIQLPMLAGEEYHEALIAALAERRYAGKLPFTALVAWGVSDALRFRELLEQAGIAAPSDLSIVLLGRTDLLSEHGGYFEVVGPRVADQVDLVIEAITNRWSDPSRCFGAHLAPVTRRIGSSVAQAYI